MRTVTLVVTLLTAFWQTRLAGGADPDGSEPASDATRIELNDELFKTRPPQNTDISNQVARAMYESVRGGESKSLAYLHEVFETYPEWRNLVADAISRYALEQRRRSPDWRLLVRSLEVVEGDRARQVIKALAQFRERSTKPRWIRQVIVLGLELGDKGAADALSLLKHWSNRRESEPGDSWKEALEKWQAWYAKSYPDQPDAVLPTLPAESKWRFDELRDYLYSKTGWKGNAARGKLAFDNADCRKCHRFGQTGEAIGPDLTQIADRMQRKQSLRAIMFPSEIVPDQYLTYSIITTDGRTFTGIIGRAEGNKLAILQADGKKVVIDRKEVEDSLLRKESAMPQGTLDRLTKQEIADLFAYLHGE